MQDNGYNSQCCTLYPCCLSILYIVVCISFLNYLFIYLFFSLYFLIWYPLPLFCPSPIPFSRYYPVVCFLYPWVCSCFAYIFICIIFCCYCSVAQLCLTLCDPQACQASLSFTIALSLLKLMSIESGMPFKHSILCHAFLLLPSVFPNIRVFSNESVLCISWPEYWRLSFSISPSNEYSGLISFRIDWFVLLAVQGTLKSLLQQHSLLLFFNYLFILLYNIVLVLPYIDLNPPWV